MHHSCPKTITGQSSRRSFMSKLRCQRRASSTYIFIFDLSRQYICWSLRCSLSMACRRCSNYSFILDLTHGFNKLGQTKCKTRRETLNIWCDLYMRFDGKKKSARLVLPSWLTPCIFKVGDWEVRLPKYQGRICCLLFHWEHPLVTTKAPTDLFLWILTVWGRCPGFCCY